MMQIVKTVCTYLTIGKPAYYSQNHKIFAIAYAIAAYLYPQNNDATHPCCISMIEANVSE